jgi:hypothetical protein
VLEHQLRTREPLREDEERYACHYPTHSLGAEDIRAQARRMKAGLTGDKEEQP